MIQCISSSGERLNGSQLTQFIGKVKKIFIWMGRNTVCRVVAEIWKNWCCKKKIDKRCSKNLWCQWQATWAQKSWKWVLLEASQKSNKLQSCDSKTLQPVINASWLPSIWNAIIGLARGDVAVITLRLGSHNRMVFKQLVIKLGLPINIMNVILLFSCIEITRELT